MQNLTKSCFLLSHHYHYYVSHRKIIKTEYIYSKLSKQTTRREQMHRRRKQIKKKKKKTSFPLIFLLRRRRRRDARAKNGRTNKTKQTNKNLTRLQSCVLHFCELHCCVKFDGRALLNETASECAAQHTINIALQIFNNCYRNMRNKKSFQYTSGIPASYAFSL